MSFLAALALSLAVVCTCCMGQEHRGSGKRSDPVPEPAITAVLRAFDHYEVVGITEAHDEKDIDDFLLALIRDPAFPAKVNDIAVECGNSLYQPILDRYIAGEQVPLTEVQKVWRDTTQPMCGESGFFEQLFPLVRAINQRLPVGHRLRVIAADPPVEWALIHDAKDFSAFTDRDASIAGVMEKEVLSKHRKALMLFGIFHLLHKAGPGEGDAVTMFEKEYPGSVFVISGLGYYGTGQDGAETRAVTHLPNPSLLRTRGTRLGALGLNAFLPTPVTTDAQCNVVDPLAKQAGGRVEVLIDAFLYVGPQNLSLREAVPADIALDTAYRSEWLRRQKLIGIPAADTLEALDGQIVSGAGSPILVHERVPDAKEFYPMIRNMCLERTGHAADSTAH